MTDLPVAEIFSMELTVTDFRLSWSNNNIFFLQSNRSQPAIGLKHTPKSRVSTYTHFYNTLNLLLITFTCKFP